MGHNQGARVGDDAGQRFVSYAHEDRAWCERLLAHLGWLRHNGRLAVFDDRQIKPGERWDDRIRGELASASIVVPLISPSFVGSRYCSVDELTAALQAGKRLVPVLVDHVDLEALPVAAVQCLPKDERQDLLPLVEWPNPNRALAAIAAAIREAVADFGGDVGPARPLPPPAEATVPGRADRGQQIKPRPPLGPNPFAMTPPAVEPRLSFAAERYVSPALSGTVTFDYSNNNGRYVVGAGDMAFETAWSRGSTTAIHAYTDPPSIRTVSLAHDAQRIEDVSDATMYDTSSRVRSPMLGEIVIWQNTAGYYLATKIEALQSRSHGSPKDEITFSYAIARNKSASFASH